MSWQQGKARRVAAMEVDDDGDDLFGTTDDDEDFNLFDNRSSKSKNPTTSKFNKAKSISEASSPPETMAHRHHHTNPATPVLRSAVTGVSANIGKQDINGITNEGFIQGVLNGSVLLGHHNSITVYLHF